MDAFGALEMAVEFYHSVEKIEAQGNLKKQLQRVAAAIALNLHESNWRISASEKQQFLQIAFKSLRECQIIFRLLKVNNQACNEQAAKLTEALRELESSRAAPLKLRASYRRGEVS